MSKIEVRKKKGVRKLCPDCGEELLLTTAHWRRDRNRADGFGYRCKKCSSAAILRHYVKFSQEEEAIKGIAGVFCPLYADRCEVCIEGAATCWRIDNDDPEEDFPWALVEEY